MITIGGKELTPARAKRLISIGRTVAPLLAPYALSAAGAIRGQWDAYRAARLGVGLDQLAAYSGPGGALHARISRIAESLDGIDRSEKNSPAAHEFTAASRPRLADLSVAIRAAAQMPGSRRRTAYKAISGELDRLEQQTLRYLGVTT
ncbi:hypothetical protein BJF78_28735 [Pseudonocardia sp. CNS-139]|nr:hypothetical protein BJF78_28735 [Pseudonocardia sp. CNS-139]